MMEFFTKQEKHVLIFLAVVISLGAGMQCALKSYPELSDYINLIDGNQFYQKIDINTASYQELTAVPFIGDYTAKAIISRREIKPFKEIEEIRSIHGLKGGNIEKFAPYLTVKEKK